MCARVNYNDLNNYYKKGIYHYNNEEYDNAIFYFEKILKYNKNFKDTKEKLSNFLHEKEIKTKNRLKKARKKEKRMKQKEKKRLRIIAQNTQLPYDDQIKLLEQIDNGIITNEGELQYAIHKLITEELRKIVDKADLNIFSKRNLKIKINKRIIANEEELKEQMIKEKKYERKEKLKKIEEERKEKLRKIEEEKKEELIKIVEDENLNSTSRSRIILKINQGKIRTKYELREEISAEKSKPKYYNRGYNTDYSDINEGYGSKYWHDLYH